MTKLIYIASPYSHPDAAVRLARYEHAKRYTAELLRLGFAAFSPIVYGHGMADAVGTHYEPWAKFNDAIISKCSAVHILALDGWKASRGIAHELMVAETYKVPACIVFPAEEFPINKA